MMIGFSMLDANRIIFLHIIKARGRCCAFGRCFRKNTGPFAASKHQPQWHMKVKDKLNSSMSESSQKQFGNWNLNCSWNYWCSLLHALVTCNASGTIQIFPGVATWMDWVCLSSIFFFFLLIFFPLFWWLGRKLFVHLCPFFAVVKRSKFSSQEPVKKKNLRAFFLSLLLERIDPLWYPFFFRLE